MSVPYSNTKLRVPKGFQVILEGLAREVLRYNPRNIVNFASAHFESLVKAREETGYDPVLTAASREDRFYNDTSFKQHPDIDPNDPVQQAAALKIQTAHRRHSAKLKVEKLRQEKAATTLQAAVRGDQDRSERSKGPKDNTHRTASFDINLDDNEANLAATKIQAHYRGFKARQSLTAERSHSEFAESTLEHFDTSVSLGDQDAAATAIQSAYRGYVTRKNLVNSSSELPDQNLETNSNLLDRTTESPIADSSIHETDNEEEPVPEQPVEEQTVGEQPGEEQAENEKPGEAQPVDETPEHEQAVDEQDPQQPMPSTEELPSAVDSETEAAAVTIQAAIRGYQTRRDLKHQSNQPSDSISETQMVNENSDPTVDTGRQKDRTSTDDQPDYHQDKDEGLENVRSTNDDGDERIESIDHVDISADKSEPPDQLSMEYADDVQDLPSTENTKDDSNLVAADISQTHRSSDDPGYTDRKDTLDAEEETEKDQLSKSQSSENQQQSEGLKTAGDVKEHGADTTSQSEHQEPQDLDEGIAVGGDADRSEIESGVDEGSDRKEAVEEDADNDAGILASGDNNVEPEQKSPQNDE